MGSLALGLVASGPGSSGGTTVTGSPAAAPTAPTEPATAPPVDPAALPACADVVTQQAAKAEAAGSIDEADAKKAAQAAADGLAPDEAAAADAADAKGAAVDAAGAPVEEPIDPSDAGQRGPFKGSALVSGPADGPTMALDVKGVSLTLAVDDATRFLVDGVEVPVPPWATAPRSVSRRAGPRRATSTST